MELRGAVALVTGGATGIGEATAIRLAAGGARVLIADGHDHRGEKLAAELGGAYVRTDVTVTAQLQEAIAAARKLGPLRAVVCCSGLGWSAPVLGAGGNPASRDDFVAVVTANAVTTYDTVRLAAAAMARTPPLEGGERGAIVLTSSTAVLQGAAGQSAYAAAMGAIAAMTRPLALDLEASGIRVNTIAPAKVAGRLWKLIERGAGPGGGTATKDDGDADAVEAPVGEPRVHPQQFAELAVALLSGTGRSGEVVPLLGEARSSG